MPLALTVSLIPSAVYVAIAVWAGAALSAPLGLAVPTLEALVNRGDALAPLRRQLVPAAIAELLCGLLLIALAQIAPSALQSAAQTLAIPLIAKLLYGGIIEEVLLRWGLMTAVLWQPWHFMQRRQGAPNIQH